MTAARWLMSGMVQGVGFRWFAYRHAQRLGLAGWVRNLPDGRVEVVAKGSEDAVAALEATLREGPRAGYVENVDRREITDEAVRDNAFYIK